MFTSLACRTRLILTAVLVLLVALFSLDAAYGQFGPPKNGNSPFENSYRCSKCGATFTSSTIGGPSHCPSCGVKFINGGFDPFDSPKGPNGPVGPAGSSSRGSGAALIVILGVGGLVLLAVVAAVGLVVFLIVRATRGPTPVGIQRRRPRYRDYDA
jgi:DNA-directed RNA polymerase subunit RPC12/RpoP